MSFNDEDGKALIKTRTFWATVITAVAVFIPARWKAALGSADDVVAAGAMIVAIIGRYKASKPVTGVFTPADPVKDRSTGRL